MLAWRGHTQLSIGAPTCIVSLLGTLRGLTAPEGETRQASPIYPALSSTLNKTADRRYLVGGFDFDAFEPWSQCTNRKQPFQGQLSID